MYASSHVSLSVEIERLTGLILKWRKLELRFVQYNIVCYFLFGSLFSPCKDKYI